MQFNAFKKPPKSIAAEISFLTAEERDLAIAPLSGLTNKKGGDVTVSKLDDDNASDPGRGAPKSDRRGRGGGDGDDKAATASSPSTAMDVLVPWQDIPYEDQLARK